MMTRTGTGTIQSRVYVVFVPAAFRGVFCSRKASNISAAATASRRFLNLSLVNLSEASFY